MMTSLRSTTHTHKNGFTLIELSIVLVIISLIAGGVLVGQDLIEGAKVRSQVSQLQEYETAVNTFRLKYNGLPGDLEDPEQFWAGIGDPNGVQGNKRIDHQLFTITNTSHEHVHALKQLSAAQLINETLDGSFSRAGIPATAIDDSISFAFAGQAFHISDTQLTLAESTLTYGLAFYLSYLDFTSGGQGVFSGADSGIPPRTVFNIDTKLDDGTARTGKVKAYKLRSSGANCLDGNDGDYDMTSTSNTCVLEYIAIR